MTRRGRAAAARLARALLPHPLTGMAVALAWAALLNDLGPGTLVTGALLGVLVPLATARFWPGRPRLRAPGTALRYAGVVVRDIVTANLEVARIVLTKPNAALRPAFMTVPLDVASPEAIAVLAGTITMTPGTLSADLSADGRSLLIHGLDVPDPGAVVADVKARYEARLQEVFP